MTSYTAQLSINLNAPINAVWEALVNPEIVWQYFYGTQMDTDWKVGSPIYFRGEWQGHRYEDKGTVLEFEPYRRLVYSYWSTMSGLPDQPEHYQRLTYEVMEAGEGVRRSITQENLDSEQRKRHAEATWQPVLDGLKKIVEAG